MKRKLCLIAAVLAAALLLPSCAGRQHTDKCKVVATNFAVYDIARAVAGDTAEVSMLLPPETESHDYEMTIADAVRITSADLFVCVGGESEDWVDDLLDSMDRSDGPRVLKAVECCASREEDRSDRILGGEEEEEEEEEPETDEHVWTSFANIRAIAAGVAENLGEIYPEGAAQVGVNLGAFMEEAEEVKAGYAALFRETDNRFIAVADRFPFLYLAEEWGLDYLAAFSGCTSNTEAPLSTVSALVDAVRTRKLPAVYVIELSDRRCAEAVARETGCAILTLQSGHNVTREEFDAGVTLLDRMRQNLEALKAVLK